MHLWKTPDMTALQNMTGKNWRLIMCCSSISFNNIAKNLTQEFPHIKSESIMKQTIKLLITKMIYKATNDVCPRAPFAAYYEQDYWTLTINPFFSFQLCDFTENCLQSYCYIKSLKHIIDLFNAWLDFLFYLNMFHHLKFIPDKMFLKPNRIPDIRCAQSKM